MTRQEIIAQLDAAATAARYRAEGASLLSLQVPGALLLDAGFDNAQRTLRTLEAEARRTSQALHDYLQQPVAFDAAYEQQQRATGHLQAA